MERAGTIIKKPMKVLIIKLSSIGDVVHTLPALNSLRKGFEERGVKARIDWLVEEAASTLLKDHPMIDNLIVVKRGWVRNYSENKLTSALLAKEGYDMVIDFQGLLKSGVWVHLSRGKKRLGFSNARELSHFFLNDKLPASDLEKHAVDRYLELAAHAGGALTGACFPMDVAKAKKSVEAKLKDAGLEGGFFVLVTRARWATKMWSDEKFVELAKRVIKKTSLAVVLAGGSADRVGLEMMREKIGEKAFNMAGLTDLKELWAMAGLSEFVVTVDSGPMHIAAASGPPVVALFGPTAPWRTGPYGKGHAIVRKGLECSPCFRKKCPEPRCMDGISVDDVIIALEGVLKGRGKG